MKRTCSADTPNAAPREGAHVSGREGVAAAPTSAEPDTATQDGCRSEDSQVCDDRAVPAAEDVARVAATLADAARELAHAITTLSENAPHDPDALLTAEQLGDLLKLSPRTLKDQATAGAIPHRRFGKHYRFSRGDVAEIIKLAERARIPRQRRGLRTA